MLTIHKWVLNKIDLTLVASRQTIQVPEGADFFHVDHDTRTEHLAVWALVDNKCKLVPKDIYVRGTGSDCGVICQFFLKHLGSVLRDDKCIWHVFV